MIQIHSVIFIILVVLLTICLINYIIDFLYYLRNRYCRFHIGRYSSYVEWKNKVEKRASVWLKKTPTVKITDNSRYMLLDIFTGKYRSHTIQSWQKASLILGLSCSENSEYRKQAKDAAAELLDAKGKWKVKPVAVDCGMLSFAILLNASDPQKVKPAMDESLAVICKNINEEGMISYTGGKNNPDMYVDTIGLVCPFLALYAKVYHSQEMEDIAFKQIDMFHRYGLYKESNLPNHAFHIKTKMPLGVYGWGRGTSWYIIGLLDSYLLFQNSTYKEQVKKWLVEAATSYKSYQRSDGGFGSILQRPQTYDSSATSVMAWFYAKMQIIEGDCEYSEISKRCLEKIKENTRITGAIDWCQGDTKDIGVFSQTYDIMPFAQGMILRTINNNAN